LSSSGAASTSSPSRRWRFGHLVTSRIQTLAGVKDTFTLITFKAFS